MIYRYYHDKFLNYIIRLARSKGYKITREDAEEICNDVFVQIWRKRDIFKITYEGLEPNYEIIKKDFKNFAYFITRKFKLPGFCKKYRPNSDMDIDNLDNRSIEFPLEIESVMEHDIVKLLELLAILSDEKKSDEEKDVLFFHYVIEIPYRELAIILKKKESKELVEEESTKEPFRLSKVSERARKELKKRINGGKLNELSKERLKQEAVRLKEVSRRIFQKLKELIEQKPEYIKAPESKIEILELFIDDLESFINIH